MALIRPDLDRAVLQFGTHRATDGLSSSELVAELLRSLVVIEKWTQPRRSRQPFSVTDRRLGRLRSAAIEPASAADMGRRTVREHGVPATGTTTMLRADLGVEGDANVYRIMRG